MTKRQPKPLTLTPEVGAMLRKRAALLQLLANVDAGLEPTRHEIEVMEAYLLGAKIPLDTEPPPAPEVPEGAPDAPGVTLVVDNAPPTPNRAQKRAAKRKPVAKKVAKKAAKRAPKLAPHAP